MPFIRAYLRASTEEQDATRAKGQLEAFTQERGQTIAAFYVENASGASLARPDLMSLLSDCREGDILLVEQVDRLSRLNSEDWETLRTTISQRRVKIVALDLPTSWGMMTKQESSDVFSGRILEAINGMLLDMLAAIARKDYEDRRRRQAQGIEKAKLAGGYRGRPENMKRNGAIMEMLRKGQSWSSIVEATDCSRSTLSRLAKRVREASAAKSIPSE